MINNLHHHEVAGLKLLLLSVAPAKTTNPLPYCLAVGGTLTQDVPARTVSTCARKMDAGACFLCGFSWQSDHAFSEDR
jgi:hypothetical protein